MSLSYRVQSGLYWDRALTLVKGCTKFDESCRLCWLEAMHRRFGQTGASTQPSFLKVMPNQKILSSRLPGETRKSKRYTYAVWSDLFHNNIRLEFIIDAFRFFARNPQHNFLILTKRSIRLWAASRSLEFPQELLSLPNVGVGVTVGTQQATTRIWDLVSSKFSCMKYVSFEPVIEHIKLYDLAETFSPGGIDWAIIGCQSGQGRTKPQLQWLESLMSQLADRVPVFLKQWDFGQGIEHLPEFDGQTFPHFPKGFEPC